MKKIIFLSLLFIVIPFFIVFFFFHEQKKEEEKLYDNIIVKVKREATNKIEEVKLEDYIVGVVAGEMPILFHSEALKAQSVAARSYVLKRIINNKNKLYDVVDTVLNQVYLDNEYLKKSWGKNYNHNILKIQNAVFMTKGEYLEYNGEIADALYFSTSNGFTENSEEVFSFEVPYLRSVESVWDANASPVFNDVKNYTLTEFYNNLGIKEQSKIKIEIIKKSNTGRILELKINNNKMTGSEVASKLKLRSNHFEIKQKAKEVTIKTTGYGHGVGMSQYGAEGMASEGYKYDEILKYYYQGVEIKKLISS
jgi:stage II sporulation protein D